MLAAEAINHQLSRNSYAMFIDTIVYIIKNNYVLVFSCPPLVYFLFVFSLFHNTHTMAAVVEYTNSMQSYQLANKNCVLLYLHNLTGIKRKDYSNQVTIIAIIITRQRKREIRNNITIPSIFISSNISYVIALIHNFTYAIPTSILLLSEKNKHIQDSEYCVVIFHISNIH